MNQYTIQNTHTRLKERLFKYIETEYLGRNDALRNEIKKDLEEQEVLWQEPFIEANPSYLIHENGLTQNENIPQNVKDILGKLIDNQLGVYNTPYKHQVDAVENFYNGKDLLVATGTGSGKTECFTWPMVTKLINEAQSSPKSWRKRGIRAIMLYPMNALVADQMSRLRNMIGDEDGVFYDLFNKITDGERIPQFGMYTGRTPYPGKSDKIKNTNLANTLRKDLLGKDEEVKKQLIEMGKYPAKYNLEAFIENIEDGKHITDERDAEMVTRLEMQENTPDILITNYSMLEYMLMRIEESSFWDNTKMWLEEESENKLLFIIDEAHMYKGAPGGEVALLIRRLMHRLNLDSDKIQFILTSASIPDNQEAVNQFACDLTARNTEDETFKIITGDVRKFNNNGKITADAETLASFSIDRFQGDEQETAEAIEEFGHVIGLDVQKCDFSSQESIQNWLYDELHEFDPLLKIINHIQGNALKFTKLAQKIFPNVKVDTAEKATNVILAIAPLAKSKEGQVLFPTRLHMMFRGLQGIFACANPNCSLKEKESNLPFGKVYLNRQDTICECGGKIYELVNHRRCGAIYFKAYINKHSLVHDFFWSTKGSLSEEEYQDIYLYIPSNGIFRQGNKDDESIWLNIITGKVERNDIYTNNPNYIRVFYNPQGVYGEEKNCPNCNVRSNLTDFSTKGNQSFYNLVSEQLKLQPQTIFEKEQLEHNPNGGRKVLLFSDSRQRAASLAKELTKAADEEALRKAVVKAAALVQESKEDYQSMDYLYIKFLEVAADSELQFFYGDEEIQLKNEIEKYKNEISKMEEPANERRTRRRRSSRRENHSKDENLKRSFDTESQMFSKYVLSFLSNQFRSLTDLGLGWIEPFEDRDFYRPIDKYEEDTGKTTILGEDISKELYSAWANQKIVDNLAYNHAISNDVHSSLERRFSRQTGITEDTIFNRNFTKLLKNLQLTNEEIEILKEAFMTTLDTNNNRSDSHLFIRPDMVSLTYEPDHEWYKCSVCNKVFPFSIEETCLQCFAEDSTFIMKKSEYEGISFYRDPIIEAIEKDDKTAMRRINTEEHTAQLSHKDQMDNMWSTTEEYELLFQDVPIEGKAPVDILSCTTTMEVGIDIGSLTAVGLRNIPPMRENYQQRAGRAGRRSSAISTIVTFINNGPHDNYYFYNPERIISGEPRTPDIDVNNIKLIRRHLNVVLLSSYLRRDYIDVNAVRLDTFFNEYFNNFTNYLSKLNLSDLDYHRLIPYKVEINFEEVKTELENCLLKIKEDFDKNEINYINERGTTKSLLDVMLEEALFPNYSFARNVIGFTVENSKGEKVDQRPDRPIDVAISEYAPGRKIVIDKKTYVSGGVYNHYSKRRNSNSKTPAKDYFENASHLKTIYVCSNRYCNWNSSKEESTEICPFCKTGNIQEQSLLIPWGFAPRNGKNENELKVTEQYSYANTPSYSAAIRSEDMNNESSTKYLRYGRLIDQKLNVINMGPSNEGFSICRNCGAAAPYDDNDENNSYLKRPYRGEHQSCKHSYEHVVIGAEFNTDMILLEIELDNRKINTNLNGMWLRSAAQTLTEAMQLAATDILDTDFNDINGGYRVRISRNKTFIDIYLFDSLSSGAGYCSMLEDKISQLIRATSNVLKCPSNCDTSCHDCLNHFGNQRVQQFLDRNLGKQLLDWCREGKLATELSRKEQSRLLLPLQELSESTDAFTINGNQVTHKGKSHKVIVQPVMWNEGMNTSNDSIILSDKLLTEALPKAYDKIKNELYV
ncbi:DEAD/DEAH box helicase [Jeotgalibaca porci]|uniref:DEAD/DEAH box helicase n=1 Tax=Jeotgalibaca porci TaxID=1868793 RepID=A0A6G7WF39_9LACT|nr:DEAD/DEAH box helicase [Jeotgalibaca porci]QIK50880.1 DEAD/DEAH box helicase [Jeotgalibaca porci]